MKRRPAAVRREQIALAALRIAGSRGLPALTAATLAEEVGVTSGALFRHFATVDAILAEAVRRAAARIEATFPDPALPPLPRLLTLVRDRVRLLSADPGLAWLLRSEQATLSLPAGAVRRLRALAERSRRFLLDALRKGAAAGSVRRDIAPEVLLVLVTGTVHAVVGLTGVHRGPPPAGPDRVLAALEKLLAERSHA